MVGLCSLVTHGTKIHSLICPSRMEHRRVVVFVDEDNGDVDDIPSDGEGLDGNDETSDESDSESSVRRTLTRLSPFSCLWSMFIS